MKPTQAEVLLRIAENTYIDNDDRLTKARQVLAEGARQILDDEEMLAKAWEINQRDKARFTQYMPQEHQQVRQRVEHRTTASAVAQIKKVENNA